MQILYNIAAILVVVLIIPVFMVRSVREKGFVERIRQSLGFFPAHTLDRVEKNTASGFMRHRSGRLWRQVR